MWSVFRRPLRDDYRQLGINSETFDWYGKLLSCRDMLTIIPFHMWLFSYNLLHTGRCLFCKIMRLIMNSLCRYRLHKVIWFSQSCNQSSHDSINIILSIFYLQTVNKSNNGHPEAFLPPSLPTPSILRGPLSAQALCQRRPLSEMDFFLMKELLLWFYVFLQVSLSFHALLSSFHTPASMEIKIICIDYREKKWFFASPHPYTYSF